MLFHDLTVFSYLGRIVLCGVAGHGRVALPSKSALLLLGTTYARTRAESLHCEAGEVFLGPRG